MVMDWGGAPAAHALGLRRTEYVGAQIGPRDFAQRGFVDRNRHCWRNTAALDSAPHRVLAISSCNRKAGHIAEKFNGTVEGGDLHNFEQYTETYLTVNTEYTFSPKMGGGNYLVLSFITGVPKCTWPNTRCCITSPSTAADTS
jgi:hypothetical protein